MATSTVQNILPVDNKSPIGLVPAPNIWICNDDIELSTSDRDILLSPVNDRIISASQALLKQQSLCTDGGFQDTVLGQTCAFQIETEEFIQILFNCRNHWLMVKNQIAALLATREKEIKLKFMDIQFNLADTTMDYLSLQMLLLYIVLGYEPGNFFFDQNAMLKNLF